MQKRPALMERVAKHARSARKDVHHAEKSLAHMERAPCQKLCAHGEGRAARERLASRSISPRPPHIHPAPPPSPSPTTRPDPIEIWIAWKDSGINLVFLSPAQSDRSAWGWKPVCYRPIKKTRTCRFSGGMNRSCSCMILTTPIMLSTDCRSLSENIDRCSIKCLQYRRSP